MYERHWSVVIPSTRAELAKDSAHGLERPAQPAQASPSLSLRLVLSAGVVIIAASPYLIEACERGAYPFPARCAPLADLPDAFKGLGSTSTAGVGVVAR